MSPKKKAPRKSAKKAPRRPSKKKAAGKKARTGGGVNLAALTKLDHEALWHPFTQMAAYNQEKPLFIAGGKGNYLYDTDGNKYFDGVSSLWCNVHGHRVPEIDSAIKKQLGLVAHSTLLGLTHEPGVRLAQKLLEIVPQGLTRVFYSDSGSSAVEIALKMAFQYFQLTEGKETPKTQFAYLSEGYHGDTLGAVSVGGIEQFHSLYKPLLPAHVKVDLAAWHKRARGDELQARAVVLAELQYKLTRNHKKLAAVILEPLVQGAGGILPLPGGFLQAARELCRAHNVLLIADEVATGFGRTGRMFACEHEAVAPDILCVAKGLTGGYLPLAATITTEKVYQAFLGRPEENKTLFHGHTFTGNPLACAAAIASLDLFKKRKTLDNVEARSEQMANWLREIAQHPHVKDTRQLGLMAGVELSPNPQDPEAAYPAGRRMGHRVILEARKRGALLRPLGDTIVLMPPLSSTEDEISTLCSVLMESIHVVCGQEELFASAARW